MLNKPLNPEPYNIYVTKSPNEIMGCDMAGNKKIIGDYTRITDLNTSEVVWNKYSQYVEAPKTRIEYDGVFNNDNIVNGKEYYWNTFYWEQPNDSDLTSRCIIKSDTGDDTISVLPMNNVNPTLTIYGCTYQGEIADIPHVLLNDDNGVQINNKKYYLAQYTTEIDISLKDPQDYITNHVVYEKDLKSGGIMKIVGLDDEEFYISFISYDAVEGAGGYDRIYIIISDPEYKIFNYLDSLGYIGRDKLKFVFYAPSDGGYARGQLISLSEENESGFKDYYLIENVTYDTEDELIELQIFPPLVNTVSEETIVNIYPNANYNISPDYYFRCKAEPTISIKSTSDIKEDTETTDLGNITKNKLYDIESDFKVEFTPGENCTDMNYYQLHYYIKSDNDDYVLVEKSNKLFPNDVGYSYKGFVDSGSYKVVAICVDNDGDEWTEELCFDVSYDIKNSKNIVNYVSFNDDDYSIKVNIENMISESFGKENDNVSVLPYSFKIYKQRSGYLFADYVGECSSWSPKLADHNIQNDMNYTYFLKATKNDESDSLGIEGIYNIGEITPVFVGSCIMGLKKTSNNTYQVAKVFHLNYHFNDCMHESTQELIRDYSGTFGKYQQEIKGSVNYLTGVAEGLLGYEVDGGYAEPNNIKNDWLEFINDDSLKLYKGMDGNTMLVSITTSKIKPRYYEEYGLVNEVNISYKQIGDTNNIAIYDLEV